MYNFTFYKTQKHQFSFTVLYYFLSFSVFCFLVFHGGLLLCHLSTGSRGVRASWVPCQDCPHVDLRLTGLPAKSPCEGKRNWGSPPLAQRFPPLDSSTEPQPPACWVSPIWKGKLFVIRRGLHHPTMRRWKSDKSPVSNAAEGEHGYDLPLLPTLTPLPPLISPRGSPPLSPLPPPPPFSIRCLCPPSALSSLGSGLLSVHSFSFALRCGEGQRVSLIW